MRCRVIHTALQRTQFGTPLHFDALVEMAGVDALDNAAEIEDRLRDLTADAPGQEHADGKARKQDQEAVGRQAGVRRRVPVAATHRHEQRAGVIEHRHAEDVGLGGSFFQQILQHLDIVRHHAVFGGRRQLARQRCRTCAQRFVEIVDLAADELEQQQYADDRHRHQGQADHTAANSN